MLPPWMPSTTVLVILLLDPSSTFDKPVHSPKWQSRHVDCAVLDLLRDLAESFNVDPGPTVSAMKQLLQATPWQLCYSLCRNHMALKLLHFTELTQCLAHSAAFGTHVEMVVVFSGVAAEVFHKLLQKIRVPTPPIRSRRSAGPPPAPGTVPADYYSLPPFNIGSCV